MKKKIINGILMSALLLAGTTSFVSCKDNVDDVETGIRQDMKSMETKISELETKISQIPTPEEIDVTQIKEDIKKLKEDVAAAATDEDLKALEKRVEALEEAIKNVASTAVTGVLVQETNDCVVGTINLPGFNPGILGAYVGENLTGMEEFPIAGDDYNLVDVWGDAGNSLKNSEIPAELNPVWNSGKKSYLICGPGNAGKIYFTINPRKVDPTLCTFDLINSTGEVSPIELSDVKPSEHLITWALGKHGNGIVGAGTRDGEEDDDDLLIDTEETDVEYGDADEINEDIANQKVYLYEADATVYPEGIEKIHFDYTKFGYQNQWDAGSYLVYGNDVSAAAEAQNMFSRFTYLANQAKNKDVEGVLKSALRILQDFYNGVFSQKNKLQYQALRVAWNDGENDVISPFDITTVTINPLNWKQMVLFDSMDFQWNITPMSKLVNKIVKAIQAKMPNVTAVNLTWEKGKIWASDASSAGVPAGLPFDVASTTIDAPDLAQIQDAVNAILKPYNKVKNGSATGIMNRVNKYLNDFTAKVKAAFDDQPCWRLTEPMMLFESNYGIARLNPCDDDINSDGAAMTLKGGKYTFIMTSLTEEYIVPVYMKYTALLVGGKVQQWHLQKGSEKICEFDIPDEPCEIVYQAADYYGNVVTKRYPLNRK